MHKIQADVCQRFTPGDTITIRVHGYSNFTALISDASGKRFTVLVPNDTPVIIISCANDTHRHQAAERYECLIHGKLHTILISHDDFTNCEIILINERDATNDEGEMH